MQGLNFGFEQISAFKIAIKSELAWLCGPAFLEGGLGSGDRTIVFEVLARFEGVDR